MKAKLAQTRFARVSAQQVDVGEIKAGPLAIGKVVVDGGHVGLSAGTASLRDLEVAVTLRMTLDWQVAVSIPWVGDFGWSGTIDFGTQSADVPLGDVAVTGLQSISIDLDPVSLQNVNAVVGAIRNLSLGALVAEQVRVREVEAPAAGFTLSGLGLTRARLEGVGLPRATATDATVGRVHGQAIPVGGVTLPNLVFPQTPAGDLVSHAVDASDTGDALALSADAGVLKVALSITPGAHMHASELRLSNVRADASMNSVELRDVVLPYDVLDIKLSQLGIETIEVPKVEVS